MPSHHLDPLEPRRLLSTTPAVPALSSRPAAPNTLYLDFDGDTTPTWAGHHPGTTPAFDTDGDPATFSPAELAAIRDAFARVADAFSPFNVNVTTVPPKAGHRRFVTVVVGGTGDWLPSPPGGISQISSFTRGDLIPQAFVFSRNLYPATTLPIVIAHEAGHTFGLAHQAVLDSDGNLLNEYNPGTPDAAPIMGSASAAAHPRWWRGPSALTLKSQDDIATLTRVLGRAPDDAPDSGRQAGARRVKAKNNSVQIHGTIANPTDVDWYSFVVTPAMRNARVWASTPGMLVADVMLYDAKGRPLMRLTPDSRNAPMSLTPGTYLVRARGNGKYNNVGSYEINLVLPPPAPPAPSVLPSPSPPPTMTLSWTYPAPYLPTTTFEVFRSADDGVTFASVGRTDVGQTTFTDTGPLAAGTRYTYRLVASDRGVTSAPSAARAARTAAGVTFIDDPAAATYPYNFVGPSYDFNGDGISDLLGTFGDIYLGSPGGAAPRPDPAGPMRDLLPPGRAVEADLNRDGLPDVLFLSDVSRQARAYLNGGHGGFRPPIAIPLPAAVTGAGTSYDATLLVADFTGDGTPDVFDANDKVILVGDPAAVFRATIPVQLAAYGRSYSTGDINGDGKADLIVSPALSAEQGRWYGIATYLGNGNGTFQSPRYFGTYIGLVGYVTGDFDRDGRTDVALADSIDSTIHLLYGTRGGALVEHATLTSHSDGDMTLADVNGDGLPDLIRIRSYYVQRAPDLFLGRPDGSFAPAFTVTGELATAYSILATGDFDGDGRTDLLVASTNGGPRVLFNQTPIAAAH